MREILFLPLKNRKFQISQESKFCHFVRCKQMLPVVPVRLEQCQDGLFRKFILLQELRSSESCEAGGARLI